MHKQCGHISVAVTVTITLVAILMVGAFWYFEAHQPERTMNTTNENINAAINTNGTSNTNANGNANINSSVYGQGVEAACADITDRHACADRADCVPVDLCSCITSGNRVEKCEGELETGCLCDQGGFDYCADLVCDNTVSVSLASGAVSRECEEDNDCVLADSTRDYGTCCLVPDCNDLFDDQWVPVNKAALERHQTQLLAANGCAAVECPDVELPLCPLLDVQPDVACLSGKCIKTM